MSDIKLFSTSDSRVVELHGSSLAIEKTLQILIEGNLEVFLGVRLLETEYSTGKTHGGRIDTLGLDENNSPVIIEYKRSTNENVINQGLFYLDWLLDHKGEFTLLVQRRLGVEAAEAIDWSAPRLVCIAGDFTKYDEHAVQQINRNIELLRYRAYAGFLLLELVNATTGAVEPELNGSRARSRPGAKSVSQSRDAADPELQLLFEDLDRYARSLGDDVTMKTLKLYYAFRRIRNFACVEVLAHARHLRIFLKVDPTTIVLEPGFSRDVSKIGHFGTGELELRVASANDLERAKPLIQRSYDAS